MTFVRLQNENLSYFVGANSDLSRPNSILAGDRNVTNDYTGPATLMRLGDNHSLRWTSELHRFRGNLLYADGRVEEQNQPRLRFASSSGSLATADLLIPSINPSGSSGSSSQPSSAVAGYPTANASARVSVAVGGGASGGAGLAPAAAPSGGFGNPGQNTAAARPKSAPQPAISANEGGTTKTTSVSTNTSTAPELPKPSSEGATASVNVWLPTIVNRVLNNGSWLGLLLLLLLLTIALEFRRRSRARKRRTALAAARRNE